MNETKQQIAVARFLRWKLSDDPNGFNISPGGGRYAISPGGRWAEQRFNRLAGVPDFLHDLNACREMEKALDGNQWLEYVGRLCKRFGPTEWGAAEASERVEELIRTIGKWEEERVTKIRQ